MKLKAINQAKKNFDIAMSQLGQKFTTTCYDFVLELRGAVDGDEDWSVIEARAFGEKLADLRASLAKGGCTNPSVYSTKVRKAACAAICLYDPDHDIPGNLEALVKAYDKEWPSKSKGGKGKGGKAKAETITIETSKLFDLVIQAGLNKAEAVKFVKAAQKLAA